MLNFENTLPLFSIATRGFISCSVMEKGEREDKFALHRRCLLGKKFCHAKLEGNSFQRWE